jgi:pimeloyl-ACP methyl ester carboxylesterase
VRHVILSVSEESFAARDAAFRKDAFHGTRTERNLFGRRQEDRTVVHALVAVVCALLSLAGCSNTGRAEMKPPVGTVVVLHGLGRTRRSMRSMEKFLDRNGYRIVSIGYPSRKKSVAELVQFLDAELEKAGLPGPGPVDFVTHSAGGILTRAYLHEHPGFPVGRVVMLAPPNRGSEVAAKLKGSALIRFLIGPLLTDLGGGGNSVPVRLPPPPYPVGVIAGDRKAFYLFPWLISGASDGLVSVQETKTDGMDDFLVVRRTHSFIMNSPEVQRQTLAFLQTGKFIHPPGR